MELTIIIPVYNGAAVLPQSLKYVDGQQNKDLLKKIIFIDDASSDDSLHVIQEYISNCPYNTQVIEHKKNVGLASTYNEGIKLAVTDFVILLHQDIWLVDKHSLAKISEPLKYKNVAAASPEVLVPLEIWNKYNFWQKCLFSRFVDLKTVDLRGKFDCFNKSLLNTVGLFDNIHFRTAGEDGDMKTRLKKSKLAIDVSEVVVVHSSVSANFGLGSLVKKEAQLAEAQGALLRKHGLLTLREFVMTFFREILIVGLLLPYVKWLAAILIVIYSFLYTWRVFGEVNPRIVVLPFVNMGLLFVNILFCFRGFILGKQII